MSQRKAARAVIYDKDKQIAVLSVRGGMYFKIPGGGIHNGETEEDAIKREAIEEAACDIEIIEKLGELQFTDPGEVNLTHYSTGFLAKKTKDHENTDFTEQEKGDNFSLMWLDVDEAIKKFGQAKSMNAFELAMNNRDLEFIKLAQDKIGK